MDRDDGLYISCDVSICLYHWFTTWPSDSLHFLQYFQIIQPGWQQNFHKDITRRLDEMVNISFD